MLKAINLKLFDGEGGGAATAGGSGAPAAVTGGISAADILGDGSGSAGAKPAETLTEQAQQEQQPAPEKSREQLFDEAIGKGGEWEDLWKAKVEQITQRRVGKMSRQLSEANERAAANGEIMEMLAQKYGTMDPTALMQMLDEDSETWSAGAEANGQTEEQYKQYWKLQRQNRQMQQQQERQMEQQAWAQREAELKQKYPDFDLKREIAASPEFFYGLKQGVDMEKLYRFQHMDEIISGAVQQTAQAVQQATTENIRAKGMRREAPENPGRNNGAVDTKRKPTTKADRDKIAAWMAKNPGKPVYL